MRERRLSDIKKIIIHCSDSDFGDAQLINDWHVARGFDCIGYHYVITNGRLRSGDEYVPTHDGIIQPGRPIHFAGAHCRGHNFDSIGICLIGRRAFTGRQLLRALPQLLGTYMALPEITGPAAVFGHHDFNPGKSCPNISNIDLRFLAEGSINQGRPVTTPKEDICPRHP